MRILITGGTGFIGRALVAELEKVGHSLTLLSRQANLPQRAGKNFLNFPQFAQLPSLDGFDAVINLAGEPIFAKRWTAAQKQILRESRLWLTDQIARKIQQSTCPPHTLISGSATGFYGDIPAHSSAVDEHFSPTSTCFTHQLCAEWEAKAQAASSEKTRVCLVRTGLVLAKSGGVLSAILPLYRYGLGGKLGNGAQHWSWISLADQVRGLLFLLHNPQCEGAFNFVAPEQVTQAQFNCLFARQLHRPACCPAPDFALRAVLGERAQLLLDNQPLIPQKLRDHGFHFQHPDLVSAFRFALA